VCHDEIVVECNAAQAVDVQAWLEKAMVEGMDALLNHAEEAHVLVEVESRVAICWAEG